MKTRWLTVLAVLGLLLCYAGTVSAQGAPAPASVLEALRGRAEDAVSGQGGYAAVLATGTGSMREGEPTEFFFVVYTTAVGTTRFEVSPRVPLEAHLAVSALRVLEVRGKGSAGTAGGISYLEIPPEYLKYFCGSRGQKRGTCTHVNLVEAPLAQLNSTGFFGKIEV